MTIRKIFALLAVMALFVAACGDSDETETTQAAATETTAAATTEAPAETTTAAPAETTTTAAPAPTIGTPDNPIQVLFVPSVSAEETIAGGQILADALNATTGLTYDVAVGSSYASVIEEMCASPDNTIGFIPAQAFVIGSELCPLDMQLKSLRFGYTEYWTEFIVPRDSDANDIFDFAGATWAYPDPNSTSGFLVPSGMFQKFGIKPGDSFEAGGHSAVVRAIYNGEADFGTVFYSPTIDGDRNVVWDGTLGNADVPEESVENCILDADGQIDCDGIFPRDARRNIREEAPDVMSSSSSPGTRALPGNVAGLKGT